MEDKKVIFTSFAGRRENFNIQFRYLDKLLDQGLINEVHLWDYTREINDSIWLKQTFGKQDTHNYCIAKYEYRRVPLHTLFGQEEFKSVTLRIRAKSDAHIIFANADDKRDIYEIVLGGWSNSRSVLRKFQQQELNVHNGVIFKGDEFEEFTFQLDGPILRVIHNGHTILNSFVFGKAFNMFVSGFTFNSVVFDLSSVPLKKDEVDSVYTPRNLEKFKVMDTPRKYTWIDYYEHYTSVAYPNHIIIKADDDVVFIDTTGFKQWLENYVAHEDECIASFPSIVNNGVCAYYQQKQDLIPEAIGTFPYDTFKGKLWNDAELCAMLHRYFIANHVRFINGSKKNAVIKLPIGDRISINMFAISSKHLGIFQDIIKPNPMFIDDEHLITTAVTSAYKKCHIVDPAMVISHLSFFMQVEKGLPQDELCAKYLALAKLHT